MHIMMIAAENGALPGGKVGGVGDVIRDVPRALARAGHRVTVVTPGYCRLSKLPGAVPRHTLSVDFCGSLEQVVLYSVVPEDAVEGVEHYLTEHPVFGACGEGRIYCDDDLGPFETDSHKFALFCNAVSRALVTGALGAPDVLHLHDWHAALLLFLRKYRYRQLQSMPTVYTIHNLSIQGVRPFAHFRASLESWFGVRDYAAEEIRDPRTPSCVNMMRMGINLADKVHVVSPTYAREILKPSDPAHGFVGGEGLEVDLKRRRRDLAGILNGCEYPAGQLPAPARADFIRLAERCLTDWAGDETHLTTAGYFALQRLAQWGARDREDCVVASVSRLTAQKVALLEVEVEPGVSALDALLEELKGGMYIMLGSGDQHYEAFLRRAMLRHENFLFLRGYSDSLSAALYRFCDFFLMPSSFEPCGISQMLAMRAGKPPLVHKVGGLADTVKNGATGFTFGGNSPRGQAAQLIRCFRRVLKMRTKEPEKWREVCDNAAAQRFSWDESVKAYLESLYR